MKKTFQIYCALVWKENFIAGNTQVGIVKICTYSKDLEEEQHKARELVTKANYPVLTL